MTQVRLSCPLDCPDTCSLLVTLELDSETEIDSKLGGLARRALKVEGDPQHPITQGFACRKTYRYPDRANHPLRPAFPMRRIGEKGEGRWQRLTWDEALDETAERLRDVRDRFGAEAILPYHYAGTMGKHEGEHVHALWRALGAVELDETICSTAGAAGWEASYGSPRFGVDPEDVVNSKFIFLWGINALATNSHLVPFITKARKNGARVVHIDPYSSKTSLYADEHIRLKPGTDAALAMAMANVIIKANMHDRAYLDRATQGFEAFARAVSAWSLERAASVTGVAAESIERLALEYARTTPSFIRVGYGMTRNESGANGLRAATLLPVLTGAWQHQGGGALLTTSGAFAALNRRQLGGAHCLRPGRRRVNMNRLASELERDAGIHALVVYNCNPAVVAPDSSRVIAGMKRNDLFFLVLENAMTETAELADILLPATTFLEHDDLYTAYGHYYLSWNSAACAPYGESRPNSWIFGELGRRLGVEEPSVYWTARELAQELLDSDHPWLADIDFVRLEREGVVRLNLPRPFLPYKDGSPNMPDGKIALNPPPIQIEFEEVLSEEFPLRLLTPPAHNFLNTTYGMLEPLVNAEGGEPRALVHPNDARRYGLQNDKLARLVSEQGRVVRRVRVTEEASEGVVVVEGTWWGARAPDRLGINTLTSERLTDLGAGSTFHNTRIRLEAVTDLEH